MANRQYVIMSLPTPVYINETGSRSGLMFTTFINETIAAVIGGLAEWIIRARRRGRR